MSTDVRNRRLVVGLCLVIGLVYLGFGLARRDWGFGLGGVAIMAAYAVVLISFRRNETISLLGGSQSDERRVDIQQRAAAFTGYLLIIVVLATMLIALAVRSPAAGWLAWLCFIGGLGWVASLTWFSRRG